MSHVLYRMYDVSGALLYVGITATVESRLIAHRGTQPWWPDVATIRLEHFPDRESLDRAELEAIRSENPRYNVARRTDPKPTRRVTPQHTVAVDDDLWERLAPAAKSVGFGRAEVLRQFISWHLREPGAKLPQRPDA